MDFAKRAYDHSYSFDPIIRSLLDTDFYKLLMLQFIWREYPNTTATFALKNRTSRVHLANIIDEDELRQQLDNVRTLRFQPNELIWLNGASFAGQTQIFSSGFIDFLRTLKLPPYKLAEGVEGQYNLEFSGSWAEVTLWEIYALSIISEMKSRAAYRQRTKFELDILFSTAKMKLWRKLDAISHLSDLNLSEFGTRRRAGFLWQEWATLAARDVLGTKMVGTSNAYLAFKHGLEAVGTNAHELPMVLAAIETDPVKIKASQYKVLDMWSKTYRGNLLVALPDTFGTSQFLRDAPSREMLARTYRGFRPDSKSPFVAGKELIEFWKDHSVDPREKLVLFSDGLDVEIDGFQANGHDIRRIHECYHGQVGMGFGWGTNMTNDFRECDPRGTDLFDPISLVCKIKDANGMGAVKLSDNFEKATGPEMLVDKYRTIFGAEGVLHSELKV